MRTIEIRAGFAAAPRRDAGVAATGMQQFTEFATDSEGAGGMENRAGGAGGMFIGAA